MKTAVDTDGLDGDEGFRAYLSGIDNVLQTSFLSDPVYVRMKSCYLGPTHLIELVASPRRSQRTAARIARDRHDGVSVQLAVRGRALGETKDRSIVSEPGTIMVLDFAQPFTVTDEEERDVINVSFPRGMLARNVADVRGLHGKVLDVERSAVLAAHLRAVAPRLEAMPVYAAPVIADIILDLLLMALDQDPANASRTEARDRRSPLADRALQVIDSRLASADLTPEWLATKLNVSRTDLYSLFESHGGVARFIWRRRLDAARTALLDPLETRRIGEIAFAFGFSSEAHFARAFKAAFGKTAGNLRRDHG